MLFSRAAWGVDLTGGTVRAARVERHGDRYRIVDAIEQPYAPANEGSEPLRPHLPDGAARALGELIETRRSTLGDPVFVALPTFGARQGILELPVHDAAKAEALLEFELHQALGGDLEPWTIRTGEPRKGADVAGAGGGGITVDYFAVRRQRVQSFVTDLRRLALPCDALVPGPIALARVAGMAAPGRGRRLVVEVQRTRSELVYLLADGSHRTRSLPFGVGTLPEGGQGPGPSRPELERLARRLFREHQVAHKRFFGPHDGTLLERVVLLGEGGRHPELTPVLGDLFGAPIELPKTVHGCDESLSSRAAHDARAPRLGTALGLAVLALDRKPARFSFVPLPAGRRAARSLPQWSAAMLLLAVGLLGVRFFAERHARYLDWELQQVDGRVPWGLAESWTAARDEANAAIARAATLAELAAALRREVGFPARLLTALASLDFGCRLVAFDLRPSKAGDEAELVFEVDQGPVGAAAKIRTALEREAAVTVTAVDTQPAGTAGLTATMRIALHETGGAP